MADEVGEFVYALLADHGGIHVGEKKPLAARGRLLHDDIDRHRAERRAHARCQGAVVAVVVFAGGAKRNVDRSAGIEPRESGGARQRVSRGAGERVGDRVSQSRDQGGHVSHET